jgi:hypothetical protein
MNLLIDFCILTGCVLAGLFSIWRSHINFSKGYIRLGYVYLLLFLFACIMFIVQSFSYKL